MCAARVGYAKDAAAAALEVIGGLVGWSLLAPLAALVPKRRDWVAVIGRGDGQFADNTKYFFLETADRAQSGLRVVHITERADVQAALTARGMESLRYPGVAAGWYLARCGTVVVDSIEWCRRARCFLLARARVVQLWHGVGFKRIELDKWRHEARGRGLVSSRWLFEVRLLRKLLRGRLRRYAAVVTTSAFYRDRVFAPAFRCRHVLTTGYPRNSFGRLPGRAGDLAWGNVDPEVAAAMPRWIAAGRRVVLVAPTFRDTRATPLGLDSATRDALDDFAAAHGFEFLFKFHPYEHGSEEVSGRHLHRLDPDSDAYPLFPSLHALVTDYSSIYMDFLLVDRPVLFLTPDLEQYVRQDRGIQFDFESMTPGPKLADWRAVIQHLRLDADAWATQRAALRRLAFDDQPGTGATARLLEFMRLRAWIPRAGS